MASTSIGYFPYNPGANPYQRLFAGSIEATGTTVLRIRPRKLFPLRHAASRDVDLLQLDWPHDWYRGRNTWTQAFKRLMYRDGLRALRKIPVVWTAHNLRAHNAIDDDYEHRMLQALVAVCDGIILLSEASRSIFIDKFKVDIRQKLSVVPHGHYIGCYPNYLPRSEARRRLELADEGRIVLSLGRLQPYKGIEDLLEAFSTSGEPRDTLIIAGKSESEAYSSQLRKVIRESARPGLRIVLRDTMIPNDDLQLYFNACDLVALPFRHILNSGSLLLAMSFGCPVVAPRLGSIPEVAFPGGSYLYDAENPRGLSGALAIGLTGASRHGLRSEILEFTSRTYDWSIIGRRLSSIYNSILGQ